MVMRDLAVWGVVLALSIVAVGCGDDGAAGGDDATQGDGDGDEGAPIWELELDEPLVAMTVTADGQLATLWETDQPMPGPFGDTYPHAHLLRVDAQGQTTLEIPTLSISADGLCPTDDGGLILIGDTLTDSVLHRMVLKLDTAGDEVWSMEVDDKVFDDLFCDRANDRVVMQQGVFEGNVVTAIDSGGEEVWSVEVSTIVDEVEYPRWRFAAVGDQLLGYGQDLSSMDTPGLFVRFTAQGEVDDSRSIPPQNRGVVVGNGSSHAIAGQPFGEGQLFLELTTGAGLGPDHQLADAAASGGFIATPAAMHTSGDVLVAFEGPDEIARVVTLATDGSEDIRELFPVAIGSAHTGIDLLEVGSDHTLFVAHQSWVAAFAP